MTKLLQFLHLTGSEDQIWIVEYLGMAILAIFAISWLIDHKPEEEWPRWM